MQSPIGLRFTATVNTYPPAVDTPSYMHHMLTLPTTALLLKVV